MLKLLLVLFCIHLTEASHDSQIDGRIIGGHDTDIVNHPYQVSLENYGSLYCGGVIIARTWILTTANCIKLYVTERRVRVGTTYLETGGQLINVSTNILHKHYNRYTFDYDIALVQLEEPITLSRSAQIIRLPNNGDFNIEGRIATVTGWGSRVEGSSLSTVLQEVNVPIISQSVCADSNTAVTYNITERMLCAGPWDGGKGACHGDGGGPLVIDSVLYGLSSWGEGCARPRSPGVYTNVGALRDWITEITGI